MTWPRVILTKWAFCALVSAELIEPTPRLTVPQVLQNLQNTEKFLQNQENKYAQEQVELNGMKEEVKKLGEETTKLRSEDSSLRDELSKEKNKFLKLQSVSLKLATDYRTLIKTRDTLEKENAQLRQDKSTALSTLDKINNAINPYVKNAMDQRTMPAAANTFANENSAPVITAAKFGSFDSDSEMIDSVVDAHAENAPETLEAVPVPNVPHLTSRRREQTVIENHLEKADLAERKKTAKKEAVAEKQVLEKNAAIEKKKGSAAHEPELEKRSNVEAKKPAANESSDADSSADASDDATLNELNMDAKILGDID